jgi:molecular chaperone GrpE
VSGKHAEEEPKVVVRDRRKVDPVTGLPRDPDGDRSSGNAAAATPGRATGTPPPPAGPAAATEEVEALRSQLAERTADLQRITAEYANYRKRVDRDRVAVVESATGSVLAGLLPVLDDIDRARQHGDLTGTFKGVADQFEAGLEKLGLVPFGASGDPFDPTVHEAVQHRTSPDVTEPTCVAVLRRGYRLGDRILRVPLVAVAEPDPAGSDEPPAEWFGDEHQPE